jgi:hypothetical protein
MKCCKNDLNWPNKWECSFTLRWIGLPGTNALAYLTKTSTTKGKSLIPINSCFWRMTADWKDKTLQTSWNRSCRHRGRQSRGQCHKTFLSVVYKFLYLARVFVRLGCKSLPEGNTQAYYKKFIKIRTKKFCNTGPWLMFICCLSFQWGCSLHNMTSNALKLSLHFWKEATKSVNLIKRDSFNLQSVLQSRFTIDKIWHFIKKIDCINLCNFHWLCQP